MLSYLQYLLGHDGRFFRVKIGEGVCLSLALVMTLYLLYGWIIGFQMDNVFVTFFPSELYHLLDCLRIQRLQTLLRMVVGPFHQVIKNPSKSRIALDSIPSLAPRSLCLDRSFYGAVHH